jgi:hypothetical protein
MSARLSQPMGIIEWITGAMDSNRAKLVRERLLFEGPGGAEENGANIHCIFIVCEKTVIVPRLPLYRDLLE